MAEVRVTVLPHQRVPSGDWTLWLLYGGRGLGKTWRLTSWVTNQALIHPGTKWRAVGRTWSEVRDILAEGPAGVRAYIDQIGLDGALLGGSWQTAFTRGAGDTRVRFANGSEIVFGSADNPDALRGGNFHGAIADEMAFWDAAAYSNLRFAVRLPLPDGGPARIVGATTPNGRNWFYRDFIEPAPTPGVVFIGGTPYPPEKPPSTFDNPHLDQTAVQMFRQVYDGTDLGEQELYGSFLSLKGAIFKGLTVARHARRTDVDWPTGPDDCDEVVAGQDLGTEHPSALIVLARRGDVWYAVAEVVKPAATEDDWNRDITATLERWQPSRIYSDRNFPQTTTAQQRRGLPVVLADKGAGSVIDGIRAVQSLVSSERLLVDVDVCPHLWAELRGYRWQTDRGGEPLVPERPVKADDDAVDALRYAVHEIAMPRRRLLFS
jgi:PBSX family phage terminase large subunit